MLKKIIVVCLCIILLIGYDFTTKQLVKYGLKEPITKSFLGVKMELVYVENTGGMLSLGSQLSSIPKLIVFRIIVPLVLILLFLYTIMKKGMSKWQAAAFILLISGGFGNWLDRITNEGRVTDFVVIGINNLHTGVFNMADIYVTAGVMLLFVTNIFGKNPLSA